MKKTPFFILLLLCVGVSGYAFFAYLVLEPGTTVAPAMKEAYAEHKVRLLSHVVFSSIALIIGPFQFFDFVRKFKKVHRALGWIYFISVFLGGASGFALSLIAYGGLVSRVGFGMLSLLWFFTATRALLAIKQKLYTEHEIWAIRCFSLALAAVTLRIYLGSFFALGVSFDEFYPLLGWLCWVPNIIIAEWFIVAKLKNRNAR